MPTPSESILVAHRVVRSLKKPHVLYCAICTKDEYSDNWQKHIEDSRHTMSMKQFDLIFDGQGSTTTLCKFCNERFAWDALKDHAKWHRIVPWYKPDDLAKRFFENNFFQWETNFYCLLCDEIFYEWYTAFVHISGEKHYREMRKKSHCEDFSFNGTNSSYESFIQNGLTSSGESLVRCKICDCSNMVFGNIGQHIDGKKHIKLKNQLIDTLKKRNNDNVSKNKASKKNPKAIEKIAKKHENITDWDFIVKSLNNKLYCKICDMEFIDYSTVAKHLGGPIHASTLKKYGFDNISLNKADHYYRCKSCNCSLSGSKDLFNHIKGKKHLNSLNTSDKQNKKIEEEKSGLVSINVAPIYERKNFLDMPCDSIVKLDDVFHLCKICNVKLTGPKIIEAHCAGKGHVSALRKYGCFFIILMHDHYYCKCCNCKIPSAENVHSHIKGQRHEKSLNEFGCRNIVIQEGNYYCKCCKCKLSDLVNVFRHVKEKMHLSTLKELNDEMNSIKENKSKMIPIDPKTKSKESLTTEKVNPNNSKVKKTRKSRKRIPKSLRLKTVPIVHTSCDVCNATVSGSAELHTHLALHFSEGFEAMINNNTTNKENEENEDDINTSSSDDDDTNEYADSKNASDFSLNLLWRGFEESE